MTDLTVRQGDLRHLAVISLLQEHLNQMAGTAPAESRHALDITGLQQADVYFYTVWSDDQLAGCGAVKQWDELHGEVKSMKTASPFLRRGVARFMLNHLTEQARELGIRRLSLETGSMAYFDPARRMYQQLGFSECEPFGDYKADPNSVFMTKLIDKT